MNGKFYLGSSTRCYHRIKSQHLYNLRRNIHTNPHLQAAWNKYGESAFEYFCVEECSKEMLVVVEQEYLDNTHCTNAGIGYNVNPYADRMILTEEQRKKISLSKVGKPRSDEVKKKISEANRKRKWSEEQHHKFVSSMTGQKRSDETKKKMSTSQKKAWKHRPHEWSEEVREIMIAARNRNNKGDNGNVDV